MKRRIQKHEPIEELRKQAIRDGLTTLLQDGIWKVVRRIRTSTRSARSASNTGHRQGSRGATTAGRGPARATASQRRRWKSVRLPSTPGVGSSWFQNVT